MPKTAPEAAPEVNLGDNVISLFKDGPQFIHIKEPNEDDAADNTVSESVSEYILGIIEKAKEEGKNEIIKALVSEAIKQTEEYIQLASKIADLIRQKIEEQMPEVNLKQVRARFDFGDKVIRLFFMIEAADNNLLMPLHGFMREIRTNVLSSKGYFSDIKLLNSFEKDIDFSSVRSDFPFERVEATPTTDNV